MSNRKRTAITEDVTGRVGDTPPATSPEELAAMTTDELHEYSRALWQATLPPVGPAPTTQAVKSMSDLLDG